MVKVNGGCKVVKKSECGLLTVTSQHHKHRRCVLSLAHALYVKVANAISTIVSGESKWFNIHVLTQAHTGLHVAVPAFLG